MKNVKINRREFLAGSLAGTMASMLPPILRMDAPDDDRPNILWITSEDNSPLLGCYGDGFATTPNLDKLASQGVLYESAIANTPVCAPARFTILTGMYANSTGTHNMRSRYAIPSSIRPYPEYLRAAGYYCANRSKTDYNFAADDKSFWDACGGTAHYRNREPGRPFFCVMNFTVSHESCLHKTEETTRHDPAKVTLPPYHPDTPEIRHDWAQYYDKVEDLDSQIGKVLDQLEKDGLAENTIVFYYSDHGGVLCRSKRFLYDTGTHVPMIIRFPEKFRHLAPSGPGSRTDRVVSFVDLAPTLLSLIGMQAPDHMQGEAFLGAEQKAPREFAYLFRNRMDERYDMMRGVRDKRYKYIRNYLPHRIYGQHLEYLWRAPNTRSWEAEFKAGRCNEAQGRFWGPKPTEELYDISRDPWEVNNLADDPGHREVLERMRRANERWVREVRDTGFIPEGQSINRTRGTTSFELVRNKRFPIDRIIETAEIASAGDAARLPELIDRLSDGDSAVRFWAATGMVILEARAKSAKGALLETLKDDSADVRIAAAEALYGLGRRDLALPVLEKEMKNTNLRVALHAVNVLDALDAAGPSTSSAVDRLRDESRDIMKATNHLRSKLRNR